MLPRLCKIALVGSVAFYLLLVVANNLSDYGSNFAFVAHVLAMDTIFEASDTRWRALESPLAHHTFYAVIILWEMIAMVWCAIGAWRLWSRRRADAAEFNRSKATAVGGLTCSLLQWFVAFLTIGGEWFLMWQSRIWNGQDAAFRMFAIVGLILLFVAQEDRDPPAVAAARRPSES